MVPPSSPETLRAQLPQGIPTQEDFLADFADTRPLGDKKAQVNQEITGLRASGNEHKAALTADVAGHRQTVRQHGQAQQAAVRARLAARSTEVTRRTAGAKTTLQAAASRAKEALKAQVDQDVATIGQTTTAKVAEARAALAARRQALTDAAEQERTGALAVADGEATRAVGELEAAAVECEQAGEHAAGRFAGEEDPKPKQRAAAHKVGRESAADIRGKKGDIPGKLRQTAADHGRRCVEYVQGVMGKLNQTEQTLVAELQDAGNQAQAATREELPGAVAAVEGRLRQDTAALDATATATRQQLQSAAARTIDELKTGVTAAAHELDTAATAVHREIDNSVDETATVVAEHEHPFLPGVLEQIAATKTGMASTTEAARTHFGTATGGAETRFAAVTQAFDAAAGPLVGQLGGHHDQIRAGFTAAVDAVQARRREAAAGVLASLRQRQQSITDAVLTEADKACQQARGELAGMNGKFREGVRQAADRSIEEGKRPRTDDVHTRAQEAAEQAGEGWLAGLGRALVQIAIGLVVVVAVALVVAAIAAAFGVILTAWTAIMIAGAILLAAGLIYSLIQRLGQKELQGRPGLAVLLALSDTIGLTGIIEGIRGKELVTDRPLSDADRTERGVLGAVTLISLIVGARAAIKGPPGGAYVRPTELPPGWRGAVPRMWRGVSSVGVELWTGMVSGLKSLKDWITGKKRAAPGSEWPPERPGPARDGEGEGPAEQRRPPDRPGPARDGEGEGPAEQRRPPDQPERPPQPADTRYNPATRTDAELQLDLDPTPRAGETPQQAAERVQAARSEIQLREKTAIYNGLGEEPPRLNIADNDAAYEPNGAHTVERHGPGVQLRRGAPGVRTIEGRIYGDPPWTRPENWSYRWMDDSTMNRTVNDYVRANWDTIRSDLALNDQFESTFDAGHLTGEGFFNEGMHGTGPRAARYGRTSYVTLRLRLLPGTPPRFFVVTAFPSGLP